MNNLVERFTATYPFELDDFQLESLDALVRGDSVIVAAPTGSGKTVVGEFAVWLAIQEGGKAFYTTPLKALSNQKFGDFVALHGAKSVGILTGDNSINSTASVVVMTTEVLRNMIYESSDLLKDLRYVVLDEVHYLQDPYRGAVWEEVIIHLPLDVKIVCLSATVSNVDEFTDWIQTVRGGASAVVETRRPVDIDHHYLLESQLLPMFVENGGEKIPNPRVMRIQAGWESPRGPRRETGRSTRGRGRRFVRRAPPRTEVIDLLGQNEMLPAIYFIFSRKGCDAAVTRCMSEGMRLTTATERRTIRDYADMRCSNIAPEDLDVLEYTTWVEALASGISSHHAGLIPAFKETVEELFRAGLVKVVFATETLSLGINMPARTVVIESMMKFSGERHELLTPGEFTQLTGRAGRRGIDTRGHAVVLAQRDIDFRQIAGLASTPTYPLISSFQPSYNMATNLIRNYSRAEAEHLLNSSFAQYRADKDVVLLEGRIDRNEAYLASYREKMACDYGDFEEYWRLRERLSRLERSRGAWERSRSRREIRDVLSGARPGQVFLLKGRRARGPVVVVGSYRSKAGDPRLTAVTADRKLIRLSAADFESPPKPVGRIPSPGRWGRATRVDADTRRRLASALAAIEIPDQAWAKEDVDEPDDLASSRRKVNSHPCHQCPDRDKHAVWAERASRLDRETAGLKRRVRSRTQTISRKFDQILTILASYGYVDEFELTHKGRFLTKIYNESDLLVAESVEAGILDEPVVPELAALVSTFVFESRGPGEMVYRMPSSVTRKVFRQIERLAERIRQDERSAGLDLTRIPEAGFAEVVHRWCEGTSLEEALGDETSPGDFIRSCKQTLDLLRQIREASTRSTLKSHLDEAIEKINRGVVAYTGVL